MKKALTIVFISLLLIGVLGFIGSLLRPVRKASINDVVVVRSQGNLELSFHVEDCFSPEMEEAILSGVPTTFRFRVVLQRKKKFPFFRRALLDIVLEHTVKYDRLKDRFRVRLPEQSDSEFLVKDLEEAKVLMSTVRNLRVIPLWRLSDSGTYQIYIKGELAKQRLPLFFRYILFFVSLWDFETGWERVSIEA
ncbi:MAG: DUF4390 domain-containing protein [Syntrophobacteraceae bacterium]|jgi:hypothetical protein|nr:DUF4390 domain-containing protein [Syntrophobacteraceae bacterium]